MPTEHWITNTRTKRYVPTQTETFDGEWKDNYPHTRETDWLNVTAFQIWDDEVANGIPYIYDLCRDGGHFCLLVDTDEHGPDDIEKAKRLIQRDHDVVKLRVMKLRRVHGDEELSDIIDEINRGESQ